MSTLGEGWGRVGSEWHEGLTVWPRASLMPRPYADSWNVHIFCIICTNSSAGAYATSRGAYFRWLQQSNAMRPADPSRQRIPSFPSFRFLVLRRPSGTRTRCDSRHADLCRYSLLPAVPLVQYMPGEVPACPPLLIPSTKPPTTA